MSSIRSALKRALLYFVGIIVILFILSETFIKIREGAGFGAPKWPDFSHYKYLRVVDEQQLNLDDPSRRLVVIGDVHGRSDGLEALVSKLRYTPETDLLIHVGDVVTRGPLEGSLATLNFLTSNNVTGVRGNHDQKVIEWRGWMEWIVAHPGGEEWMEKLEKEYPEGVTSDGGWIGLKGKKWMRIPNGWKFNGDHYKIARQMSEEAYEYLLSLPLVVHFPSIHTFVVHAGILPHDPRRSAQWDRQPLAHIPEQLDVNPPEPTIRPHAQIPIGDSQLENGPKHDLKKMRKAQELSVLAEVPQNADPWVLMNVRGIKDNGDVTRDAEEGTFWADLWNTDNKQCGGYESPELTPEDIDVSKSKSKKKKRLPCYPSTVIYGHTAGRDLDLRRWSKGIDTGCVYERELTAFVVSSVNSTEPSIQPDETSMVREKFGEAGKYNAKTVSVSCGPL